jgi:hypothetical protein
MSRRRRWLQRYLDLFVMEVRRPDGSTFIMSLDSTGLGECWLPIETTAVEEGDISLVN